MIKKKILCFVIVTFMSLIFSVDTYAADTPMITSSNDDLQISPKAEQIKWYYRNYNGLKQKRLWSITYGYWKTDWMSV